MTADMSKELTAALGSHGLWKARLVQAVATGANTLDLQVVKQDDQCDFGKWLYRTLPGLTGEQAQRGQAVRDLHRTFHAEAAKVLTLATSGNAPAAKREMDGTYSRTSADLTKAIMEWKTHR
jgi:hypothetical protein